jgi:hypothetical protein
VRVSVYFRRTTTSSDDACGCPIYVGTYLHCASSHRRRGNGGVWETDADDDDDANVVLVLVEVGIAEGVVVMTDRRYDRGYLEKHGKLV